MSLRGHSTMRKNLQICLLLLLFGCLNFACQNDRSADNANEVLGPTGDAESLVPSSRLEVVEEQFHGVTVRDPFRWLEADSDKEVIEWTRAQNTYARRVLDAMPERAIIHERLTKIFNVEGSTDIGFLRLTSNGSLFALRQNPDQQQRVLVVMSEDASPDNARIVADPTKFDASGNTAIDWYEPSHDGKLVAVSMSANGTEMGNLHVIDVETGESVDTVIERVSAATALGDIAWFPNNAGFYYTRYPRVGERAEADMLYHQQLWAHTLGDSVRDDVYVIGADFPRIAEIRANVDPTTGRLLVWVQDGDSGRFALHMRQPSGSWTQFSEFGDGHLQAEFGPNNRLYVLSHAGSPRGKILVTDAGHPDLENATEVVPESDGSIANSFYFRYSPTMLVSGDHLNIVYDTGGPSELQVFSLDGEPQYRPDTAPVSTVFGLEPAPGGGIYFCIISYVSDRQWFRFDPTTNSTSYLPISAASSELFDGVSVIRELATSKDGTKIPVNILIPRGIEMDGSNAIVVTGYGGYGMSLRPVPRPSSAFLLEHGVLFAEANLRGGGEFGAEWRKQGNLTNKQNVFDDFAAVLGHLVLRGYANPDRVAIIGASNGGLLMGATMVQNPDLVSAVVSHVGIYDMIRAETGPNGTFNIPEFGTVNDPYQFQALYAYSPFHNVRNDIDYPPILLTTGMNDMRVEPFQSRKFAARLQTARGNGGEVLLRISEDTGHGIGSPLNERINILTDSYAFIFSHLKIPVREM